MSGTTGELFPSGALARHKSEIILQVQFVNTCRLHKVCVGMLSSFVDGQSKMNYRFAPKARRRPSQSSNTTSRNFQGTLAKTVANPCGRGLASKLTRNEEVERYFGIDYAASRQLGIVSNRGGRKLSASLALSGGAHFSQKRAPQ